MSCKDNEFSDVDEYKRLYDNLEVGIVVFKGKSPNELKPFFCNAKYSKISGFSFEQFKSSLIKDNLYCVHSDDITDARKCFVNCYKNKISINHTLRVKGPQDTNYRYVSMSGNIKHNDDKTFELYLIFNTINDDFNTQLLILEKYNNFINKAKKNAKNTLVTIHFNVTKNTCYEFYRAIKTYHPVLDNNNQTIDTFLENAGNNIAEEIYKKEFLKNNSQKALTVFFEQGNFQREQKIPVRLNSNQIIWCSHKIFLTRNPDSKELECVMTLEEDDKSIRIKKSFDCLMEQDYDTIANMNIHTGLVTVLNVSNSRGINVKDTVFYHQDFLRNSIKTLVPEEFVEDAIQSLQLKTIIEELKTKKLYVITYPAKKINENEPDKVYQWRLYYTDDTKDEVLFTRSEMLGFLNKQQKADTVLSDYQKQINKEAEKTREGKSKRNKILVADDSEINRQLVSIIFEDKFTIIEAADGQEAINLIDKHHESLALILLDMLMPKKTGLDVLLHLQMRNLNNLIPTMLVTGNTSKEMGLKSLEYGISDIVNKPFDSKIVKRRALNLIELYAHKEDVENQLELWKKDALALHEQQETNNELLINALSSVVEFRSVESGTHIRRVRALTKIMLETWVLIEPDVHLTPSDIQQIARASTLHDIGKVAIPDTVLLKPGRLEPDEFEIMKTHTTLGCQMLEEFKQEDNDFYKYCYDICRHHHERSDGRGYPDGLKEDEIPFWAQIVSIVDVYDALISPRVYKAAFSSDKAISMIQNGECGVFSKRLLKVFDAAKETIIIESEKMAEK